MAGRKWLILAAVLCLIASAVFGYLYWAGNEEKMPGGTLVKVAQEVGSCE